MTSFSHVNRFEDQMEDFLSTDQIDERNMIGTAHRMLIAQGKGKKCKTRSDDTIGFKLESPERAVQYKEHEPENHIICRHLDPKGVDMSIDEVRFWNILNLELTPEEAQLVLRSRKMIETLPKEAHEKGWPIFFDGHGQGHSDRTKIMILKLAKKINHPDLSLDALFLGAQLHDIGKLKNKLRPIFTKQGHLANWEWQLVKQHPEQGEQRLNRLIARGFIKATEEVRQKACATIRSHHERWDGEGYPDRKRGKEIPIEARILGLVDSFDAMVSNRKYNSHKSDPVRYAIEEIKRCSGLPWDKSVTTKPTDKEPKGPELQFDPSIAEVFLEDPPQTVFHQQAA